MIVKEAITSYIAGKWEPVREKPLVNLPNPANLNEIVEQVQFIGEFGTDRAVIAARRAFDQWRKTPPQARIAFVNSLISKIESRRDELAEIITLENGKTLAESRAEISSSLNEMRFQIQFIAEKLPEEKAGHLATRYEPLGVILLLTPWNFPLATIVRKLVPALLTGNTVVVKPSEYTPKTAWFLFQLMDDMQMPIGVANLVLGEGKTAGVQLVDNPQVDAISFTGSTLTGKAISQRLGGRRVRFQAEMGGSNAVVILPDADLEEAADAVLSSGFACCGQWCTGTTRVIVDASVYTDFLEILRIRVERIVVGDGRDPQTTMGPLISEVQLNKIRNIVKEALTEGAKLLCGGNPPVGLPPGYYFKPTILADVQSDMPFVRKEIFGPVLVVMPVKTPQQALQVANDSPFGLSFSVYTRNVKRAENFLQEVQAGMCHVNLPTGYRDPALPVFGWKDSGYGWPEAGRFALDFFTQPKAIYRRIP